mgnify:CR=1 FL=1
MATAPGDQAAKAPDFPYIPASDEELEALLAQPGIKGALAGVTWVVPRI